MIALFMILVMGVALALHIVVAYLFSKLGKDNGKKRFMFGSLGFLIVFSIFFGDHIVKYLYIKSSCVVLNKDIVYDKKLYESYKLASKNKNYKILNKEEIQNIRINLKNEYDLDEATEVVLDKKNNLLKYNVLTNDLFISNIINLNNNELVSEYENHKFFGQGGWFCKTINNIVVGYSCPIDCK
ncbi:MAG: hypothetical protein BWY78_00320 [Alphaproteobacteria bacterium ADurb.Bin438]|nr:MAG: hypothetical protein BWY78_00320 [Alphaproteobacteria bacterium ADurb.Bin438]